MTHVKVIHIMETVLIWLDCTIADSDYGTSVLE